MNTGTKDTQTVQDTSEQKKPGPLAARVRKTETKTEVKVEEKPAPPVKKPKKPMKRLRVFNGFDEKGFHPTMVFQLIRREDGAVVSIEQQWCHKKTDEPEWREIKAKEQEL